MKMLSLKLENIEEVERLLSEVSFAEGFALELIGGGKALAKQVGTIQRLQSTAIRQWCICRGPTTVGIDAEQLYPTKTSLSKLRAHSEIIQALVNSQKCPIKDWYWDIDGTLSPETSLLEVDTALGKIFIGVETADTSYYKTSFKNCSHQLDPRIRLPVKIDMPRRYFASLDFCNSMSIIVHELPRAQIGSESFFILKNLENGKYFMQKLLDPNNLKVDEVAESSNDDGNLPVTVHLGEIELQLSQLAKLRAGHSLILSSVENEGDNSLPCFLSIGSSKIASAKLKMLGERVALTIVEIF